MRPLGPPPSPSGRFCPPGSPLVPPLPVTQGAGSSGQRAALGQKDLVVGVGGTEDTARLGVR